MPETTCFKRPPRASQAWWRAPCATRAVATARPWLIAVAWLLFAGLFKAALGQTPSAPSTTSTSLPAADDDGPSVTLLTPFSPGSGPDHVARTMAQVWTERSGERVVVRNLPERQGYIAARLVATAPPDGRVLLLTSSPLLERPARLADEPFQPPAASASDFTPLARVGQLPFVTVFPPGMFGRWLTPLSTPPAAVAAASALPAAVFDRSPLAAPPGREDFEDITARDAPAWNALLAPPRLSEVQARRLRADWQAVVSDARVRLALAQTGTELWEIPQDGVTR